MRVVIAPDSFKGSLTAEAAGMAMAAGVRRADKSIETIVVPMADGGEGTLYAWKSKQGGRLVGVSVMDPLSNSRLAHYLQLDNQVAVLEMARASGLHFVPEAARQPSEASRASSYGTGQLILHAMAQGVRQIVLAVGGSATTDGGYGLFRALGAKYFDDADAELTGLDASELARVQRIDVAGLPLAYRETTFTLAADVTAPLSGKTGSVAMYGRQKGMNGSVAAAREAELQRFAGLLAAVGGVSVDALLTTPGLGAGGGVALPLFATNTRVEIRSGAELIGEATSLPALIATADVVMTGEGTTDAQSSQGKVPGYIAAVAQAASRPAVAIVSGAIGEGAEALFNLGVTHMLASTPEGMKRKDWLPQAADFVQAASYHIMLDILSHRTS